MAFNFKIEKKYDKCVLSRAELQQILKDAILKETGRAVRGDVIVSEGGAMCYLEDPTNELTKAGYQ